MWLIFIFMIISFSLSYSQNDNTKAQITNFEVEIPANKLTKINMYNSDSSKVFVLFDNILEQNQKVLFIVQPTFYQERGNYENYIVLPFPKINSGLYFIHFENQDTCFVKKMVFLK